MELAPRLSLEQRTTAASHIFNSFERINDTDGFEQLLGLMPFLESSSRDRLSARAIAILLDFQVSSQYFEAGFIERSIYDQQPIHYAVMATSNPKSLANLLSHPGCTDDPREWMLLRFEELLFHEGKHVLLRLPDSDQDSDDESSASDEAKREPPPRRFHTTHDAAVWIQENWPDFDLEATPEVQWRGDR